MADNLNLKTKYPSIQSLKDQGLPADFIALAEQTKTRLIGTRYISELSKSDYDRIKRLFTEGNISDALTEIAKKGITLPQDMIVGLQKLTAAPIKDNEKAFRKAAEAIPWMGLFLGTTDVVNGSVGILSDGLSGVWNSVFPAHKDKRAYFSPQRADLIAATYAGAMYERTKDLEVKSFSNGLFSKEFFPYLGAGVNFVSSFLGGSEIGIAIQAGVTWLIENVSAFLSGKEARSYDEIASEIRAGYESNAGKDFSDYVRSSHQDRVREQAGKDLVAAGVLKEGELPAVNNPESTKDKEGRRLDEKVAPNKLGKEASEEAVQEPVFSDPMTGYSMTNYYEGRGVQNGKPVREAEKSNVSKIIDGSLGIVASGFVIATAPATWSVDQVITQGTNTVEAARDGDVGNTLQSAGLTLAAAKATQMSATGFKIPFTNMYVPGVVQAFGWVGKKTGQGLEAIGLYADTRANAKDTLGAKTWVSQQAEDAKAALKASNPGATEKQLADAALKAEFEAHKIAETKLNELKAARAAETNLAERGGKALQTGAGKVTATADTIRDVSFIRPILKSPWTATKALLGFGASGVETVKGAVNAVAAARAVESFTVKAGLAPEVAGATRGFRMPGGAASTVVLGAIIGGGATYAMTGDANAAVHNAGEALPVAGTIMAANQGRTVEAWIRGATDAGIAGTVLTSPLAVTGVGATIPTIVGVGTLAFNEVARPIARLAGQDVDPSIGEMAARSAVVELDAAGKRVEQRKAAEYTGAELRDGLLNHESVIYAHFAGEVSKQYDATIAKLIADNDGKLPSTLPPSLRNRDAYITARIDETLRLKTGSAAMDAPTGVKRLSLPAADDGIAAAAAEMARESARATGLGKTGIQQAQDQKGKDLLSFVPDSISGNSLVASYQSRESRVE